MSMRELKEHLLNRDSASAHGAASSPLWGVWGTIGWGIGIVFAVVLISGVSVVWVALAGAPELSGPAISERVAAASRRGSTHAIVGIVCNQFGALLVLRVVKLKKRSVIAEYLALNAVGLRPIFLWLLVLAAYLAISDSLTLLIGRPIVPPFVSGLYATTDPKWLLWLELVVLAPLFEEAFFRGFLFAGIESTALRPIGAIVVTSALWAIVHLQYDTYGVLTIVGLGFLLGAARLLTGSLVVPFILHAAANATATLEANFFS